MISAQPLGEIIQNVGTLILDNSLKFGEKPAFAERRAGVYCYWNWKELQRDIIKTAAFFEQKGLKKGDRCAFISSNCYARLVTEMAAMSLGLVTVPIFQGYPKHLITELIAFAKVKAVVMENQFQYTEAVSEHIEAKLFLILRKEEPAATGVSYFEDIPESGEAQAKQIAQKFRQAAPETLAMIMFTSGTSGFPKGVQLTHKNLMSQQKALQLLWQPEPGMRFLCYLPWHHSFGGLFERFFALSSGGCLAIDDSWGRNIDQLFKNFSEIQPQVYFSVPKVYQEIVARVLASKEAENIFFNSHLKFVFTAAAPLPLSTSAIFKAKGIPVVEGWGLTETSPCCTLTEKTLDRAAGVVGFPIPGVEVKLGEENEILVRGANVMSGYLDLPDVTERVLNDQGWFKTGDIGEITSAGLKILSRKDRMFKLGNGEKVFPSQTEERIKSKCKFVKHAYVFGSGQPNPCLLVFPNMEMLSAATDRDSECEYPKSLQSFSSCMSQCLQAVNETTEVRWERVHKAIIIPQEPSIENNELTPSLKLIPRSIEKHYEKYIRAVEENRFNELPADALAIPLPQKIGASKK